MVPAVQAVPEDLVALEGQEDPAAQAVPEGQEGPAAQAAPEGQEDPAAQAVPEGQVEALRLLGRHRLRGQQSHL